LIDFALVFVALADVATQCLRCGEGFRADVTAINFISLWLLGLLLDSKSLFIVPFSEYDNFGKFGVKNFNLIFDTYLGFSRSYL
jgi:hypothetical protein